MNVLLTMPPKSPILHNRLSTSDRPQSVIAQSLGKGNSIDPPEDPRWEAAWEQVLARDASADGAFVYAVRTTGICCRPSCPSRRPARKHVCFFRSPGEAIAAGFRACLRCRPDQRNVASSRDAELVQRLSIHLQENNDRSVTLEELGKLARLNPSTVQRKFEQVLGVSPRQFQLELRAAGFRSLLTSESANTEQRITDAVYKAGYSASSRLYTNTGAKLGMTPTRFRAGGRGETIHYVLSPCALGHVLVGATAIGVCWVGLGDCPETLEAEFKQHFRAAAVVRQGLETAGKANPLQQALDHVLSQLTDHPATARLPLDLRATVFQQRVWRALTAIPRGQTRSYSEVAAELGQPTAARAVARACASNPVALLVPCHRVVGKDGGLTGYRWGAPRKQSILKLERSGRS